MILAADQPPGTHPTIQVCGNAFLCVFNYDTLISSGIAIVLTLGVGLGVAYRLSHGKPGKLQMVLELLLSYIRNLTRADGVGRGHGLHHPDRRNDLHLHPVRQLARLLSAHGPGRTGGRGHQSHHGDGDRGDRDRAVVQHPRARVSRLPAALHQAVRAAAARHGSPSRHSTSSRRFRSHSASGSGCSATSSAGS